MAKVDIEIVIEKYLKGTASEEEIALVNKMKATDEDFARRLESEQFVYEFTHLGGLVELKAKMKNMQFPASKPSNGKWWLAAAGLVFISGVVYFYATNENLAKQDQTIVVDKSENKAQKEVEQPEELVDTASTVIEKNSGTLEVHVTPKERTVIKVNDEIESVKDSLAIITEAPKTKPRVMKVDSVDSTDPDINACQVSFIEPVFEVKNSCEGESTGEIFIKEVDGSFPPYKYKLAGERNITTVNRIFSGLEVGLYNLTIVDSENCSKSFDVKVGEKECRTEEKFLSSLNPGVPCVFELAEPNGVLYIFNAEGSLINQINFTNTDKYEWFGRDKSSTPLPTGEYFYQIKYSSGKLESGNITIAN